MKRVISAATMAVLVLPLTVLAQAEQQSEQQKRFLDLRNQITQITRALARPQRFRVVLIVSSTLAEPPVDNIPADARKALEDMKAFLPFKSYRLFGTGDVESRRGEPASMRINGGDNQTFEIVIARDAPLVNGNGARFNPPDPRLSLTFILRDVTDLSASVTSGRTSFEGPSINTLVTMDVGETIVVGTSRVKGSRGLLALLTALPDPGK